MDTFQTMEISATGLDLQRLRMEVVARNIANMNAVHAENGQPYQPLMVVSRPALAAGKRFAGMLDQGKAAGVAGQVMKDPSARVRVVHEPGHPHADKNGMVRYPGVDHAQQMVTMTEALRAYEANLAAMQAARMMAVRALEIGANP